MRIKLQVASAIAVAATFLTALAGTTGSSAAAEEVTSAIVQSDSIVRIISEPVIQPLPSPAVEEASPAIEADSNLDRSIDASSLAELAAAQTLPASLSREMHCLAGAIYFESRGEPLQGQLAVGRVIVERAQSGLFPESYCGVVFQRSQFSFVRGGRMPRIRTGSQEWRDAVAIAQIADSDSWESPVEGALFFHATRVSPNWRRNRLAQVGNHVFYR